MPLDYSKWDALELSDDSDIEVHPNVDKRSFIRAKQNQIHMERQQRKNQIETLKYERIINDSLIKRISSLLSSLKTHASDAKTKNPGEVAFRAVMESAAGLDPKDDQPPPRPAGVHNSEEKLPTYTKMMATLLDQVNKALDEKKIEQDKRYDGMVTEVEGHLKKVNDLQGELLKKLSELEKEEASKITSEGIHTGFDSSHINKSTSSASGSGSKDSSKDDDDTEIVASPLAAQFSQIKSTDYRASLAFLSQHPQILTERETDALLIKAFDAQLENKEDLARNCVHQALLLQYCRALGRDGVSLFFKRITTPGHQAQDVFVKDVQDTYTKIKTRAREIVLQRAKEGGEAQEQVQLYAVEPGTVINITVPEMGSQDEEGRRKREIFEGFSFEMRRALETGNLDEVNKAGILSLEEEMIDATTEEGQEMLKKIEKEREQAKQAYDDPE
ncbi:hsp90 co-chaperone Cdc37 [Collariella sp. IMI 366227]|nr:hsp90 co-chaperone Cdc37 [Collariella sp. IMI 366227]